MLFLSLKMAFILANIAGPEEYSVRQKGLYMGFQCIKVNVKNYQLNFSLWIPVNRYFGKQ